MNSDHDDNEMDWLEAELADTLDEDYELELSEPALSLEIRRISLSGMQIGVYSDPR